MVFEIMVYIKTGHSFLKKKTQFGYIKYNSDMVDELN